MTSKADKIQRLIHELDLNPTEDDKTLLLEQIEVSLRRGEFTDPEIKTLLIPFSIPTQFLLINYLYLRKILSSPTRS